jgi:Mn2+/Fe2+ NRAMP family transporter
MVAIPALFMNLSEVTDLSVIGTLFAFTIVCAGVLVKDKEFAGQNRFVPYISTRILGPALLIIVWFIVVFAKGISVLDVQVFDSFSTFIASLTNAEVYRKGLASLATFFTDFTPSTDDLKAGIETSFRVFLERVPYFVFMLFSIGMAILCFLKRLSLIPVLGVMCCSYLMTELGWKNWTRFFAWMVFGFVVYFFYSYTHSKLHNREEAAEA